MYRNIKIVVLTPYNYVFQRVGLRLIDQMTVHFGELNRTYSRNNYIELDNNKVHLVIEMISKEDNYNDDNRADVVIIDPSYFKFSKMYHTFDYLKNTLLNCPNDIVDIAERRIYFLGEDGHTLKDDLIY